VRFHLIIYITGKQPLKASSLVTDLDRHARLRVGGQPRLAEKHASNKLNLSLAASPLARQELSEDPFSDSSAVMLWSVEISSFSARP
jgi:hypothetical protein